WIICGRSAAQIGIAAAQRVRNLQPEGGDRGLGISPSSGAASGWSGFTSGIEASSACVYGCNGAAYNPSGVQCSTTWPRYMTSTWSDTYWTTLRSWLMKM